MNMLQPARPVPATLPRPLRLGFLGTGWIGRHRMQALLDSGVAAAAAISDASDDAAAAALQLAPAARRVEDLDALLELPLDGVVIATPSAQHARQAIAALQRGAPVFCQKPLGRSAAEAEAVVAAARASGRLLGVDLSYRHTAGMQWLRQHFASGEMGTLIAADLVFHNAYGPDKPWFYDRRLSGGGAMIDLGIHLADLALWVTGFVGATVESAAFYKDGRPLSTPEAVEDFALATLKLETGATVRIAASWRAHAGAEAEISASFFGTAGGARFRNVGGSFYDFEAQRLDGTTSQTITAPPDDWGGRAATDWARQLAMGVGFDEQGGRELVAVAQLLDAVARQAGGG